MTFLLKLLLSSVVRHLRLLPSALLSRFTLVVGGRYLQVGFLLLLGRYSFTFHDIYHIHFVLILLFFLTKHTLIHNNTVFFRLFSFL